MFCLLTAEKRDDPDRAAGQLLVCEDCAYFVGDRLRLVIIAVVRISYTAFNADIDQRRLNAF